MKTDPGLQRIPTFATDDDAERFVESADLSMFDLSGFRVVKFEIEAGSSSDTCLSKSSPKPDLTH